MEHHFYFIYMYNDGPITGAKDIFLSHNLNENIIIFFFFELYNSNETVHDYNALLEGIYTIKKNVCCV